MSFSSSVNESDFMSVPLLRNLQWRKLDSMIRHAYANVPWYCDKMKEAGVTPNDVRSLEDIRKLPFIVKKDLRDTYPFGLFAVPLNEVVRLHASSGTTGKPIVTAYTEEDLNIWKEVVVRSLISFGVNENDIVQNSFGYGLFTGGLGLHGGVEALGGTILPISGGNTDRQIMLMKDFKATVIACTPSYFVHLAERAEAMGVDLKALPLRIGIFGAEPWTLEMRRKIEDIAGIKAYDIYGLTEIVGPGVGAECPCQNGIHIFEDHFYPEIIDPDTLEVLPDGETGELVFSTLSKRAMPLLRYRTRDITRIIPETCACGRTLRRIGRISHRSDDMFIIRGVNVFPGQIEAALLTVDGTLPVYQIILTKDQSLDRIEVQVELSPDKTVDTIRAVSQYQKEIADKISRTIGISVKVTLMEPFQIPRSEGKAKRVIDKRV